MGTAVEVSMSERQRAILEKWVRNKADTPYRLILRCQLIGLSAAGVSNAEQGRRLNVDRQRSRRWRRRWSEAEEPLAMIIAVACELPEDCGRPVTHWTPREWVDEVVKRGIVDSISPRHVDRLLKGGISVHTRAGTG